MKRRRLDLRTPEAVLKEVDRLLVGGYRQAGNWDLAQACRHLSIALTRSVEGTRSRPSWLFRYCVAPLVKRRLMKTRSIPLRVNTPRDLAPPAGLRDAEEVSTFKAAVARAFDPASVFDVHPLFGKVSPDEWREFHLIHISHHLSFLIPEDRLVV